MQILCDSGRHECWKLYRWGSLDWAGIQDILTGLGMSIENGETELSSGRLSCQDQSAGCVTQSSTEVVDRASSMDPSN